MQARLLNVLYAVVWFAGFTYFAWLVYSGELFRPEGIRIHVVALMVAWVVVSGRVSDFFADLSFGFRRRRARGL